MRILIIDDQENVTQSLKEAIEPGGHECILYNNPVEALKRVCLEHFDVVVTDYKMPEMTGIELLKKIQEQKPGLPVLIFTGYADTQNAIDAVNNKAYAFLRKPIDIRQFMSILNEIDERFKAGLLKDYTFSRLNEDRKHLSNQLKVSVNETYQMIQSMINMQSRFVNDEEARKSLNSLYDRIHAFAMVHEKIFSAPNPGVLDLQSYLNNLTRMMYQLHRISDSQIQIKENISPVSVSNVDAFSWGFILHELLTNAIKHAFDSAHNDKTIQIELCRRADNSIFFSIEDNGKGLTKNIDLENPNSLGLHLVTSMVSNQLSGKIHFETENGTRVEVRAPAFTPVEV